MGKKHRLLFLALLVAALGAFAWAVLFPHHREPFYKGKPLSFWLTGYWRRGIYDVVDRKSSEEAMQHVGTDAIPTLLRMLQKTDSPLKFKLLALSEKQHFIKIPYTPATVYNNEAGEAFRALGPLASNAVPELIRIYDHHVSTDSQVQIARIFSMLGPSAKAAVPSLVRELTNDNVGERLFAIVALGDISSDPGLAVPALIKCLNDSDTSVQSAAAISLGAYGKDAKAAVPALLELCKDAWKSPPWGFDGEWHGPVSLSWQSAMTVYEIDPATANQMVAKARSTDPKAPQ